MLKVRLLALLLIAATYRPAISAEPVKIIFDTDMDSDCDDIGALAMLHILSDRGEVEILAAMASAQNNDSARCIDAMNTWYGRPDIPIGVPKGNANRTNSKFAQKMAAEFPHDLKGPDDAADAAELYRSILIKQPEKSVVILTVGDLTNIADLLKLPVKGELPSGIDVVKKHVKEWVCMGGNFVGKPAKDDLKLSNNNFTGDKAGSYYAVHNWPGKLMFVGREIGSVPSGLKAGARAKDLPASHPVRRGYELYFGGEAKDRHVADQTAVLYAVHGLRDYWDAETIGYMDLQPDNTFEWRTDRDSEQSYLLKKQTDTAATDRRIEKIIEELMLAKKKE